MVSRRGCQHRWVDCGLQRRIHSQGELGIHDNRGQHISRDGEADRGLAGSPQGTHDHSCHPPLSRRSRQRVHGSLESDSLRRNCRARCRGESGRRRRGRARRSRESFVRRRLVPIERARRERQASLGPPRRTAGNARSRPVASRSSGRVGRRGERRGLGVLRCHRRGTPQTRSGAAGDACRELVGGRRRGQDDEPASCRNQ